jgi:hypothetical protein
MGLRKMATAFLTGALMVSTAWAGASLVPAPGDDAVEQVADTPAPPPSSAPPSDAQPRASAAAHEGTGSPPAASSLPDGYVLAGAAKTSIAPRPAEYGGTWERDHAKCARLRTEGC